MKNVLLLLIISLFITGCSSDQIGNFNPYLPAQPVNFSLNLNNPDANDVKNPNGIYITPNYGISGLFIRNAGGYFAAFDLACANHPIHGSNSRLQLKTPGRDALVCKDLASHQGKEFFYSTINGMPLDTSQKYYPLKSYPVQVDNIRNPQVITIRY
ncbi:hypothetical protein ACYSNM_03125 [Myroides sp. LJL116]